MVVHSTLLKGAKMPHSEWNIPTWVSNPQIGIYNWKSLRAFEKSCDNQKQLLKY